MLFHERCQLENDLQHRSFGSSLSRRYNSGPIGRRTLLRDLSPSPIKIGSASIYSVGAAVRVKPRIEIQTMLRAGKTRGLLWSRGQWETCGSTYYVQSHVQHILDDSGRRRPVERTVTLSGVTCAITGDGCGGECPFFYRDEWLDADTTEDRGAVHSFESTHVVMVRAAEDLRTQLDWGMGTEGIKFLPEMWAYAGRTFRARRLQTMTQAGYKAPVTKPLYVLEGVHCAGTILGCCDRRCALLWHEQWLVVRSDAAAGVAPKI
jgi:hypothetical protein